jgi:hypothetical protein
MRARFRKRGQIFVFGRGGIVGHGAHFSLRVDLVSQTKLTERGLCFLQFLFGNTTPRSDFGFHRELQSAHGSKLRKNLCLKVHPLL